MIMESTISTWSYTCGCRKEIQFDIEREAKPPRDRDFEVDQVEKALLKKGWVSRRLIDNDDRPRTTLVCLVPSLSRHAIRRIR